MGVELSALIAWLNRDLWGPVWPNLAASVIWAAPVMLHNRRLRGHVAELTEHVKELRHHARIEHQSEEAPQ